MADQPITVPWPDFTILFMEVPYPLTGTIGPLIDAELKLDTLLIIILLAWLKMECLHLMLTSDRPWIPFPGKRDNYLFIFHT